MGGPGQGFQDQGGQDDDGQDDGDEHGDLLAMRYFSISKGCAMKKY
jgi:hypothetical protein